MMAEHRPYECGHPDNCGGRCQCHQCEDTGVCCEPGERERIAEHYERGLALGQAVTAAAEGREQVCRLALSALDAMGLPAVRADPGSMALHAGIVTACAEWVVASASQATLPTALMAGVLAMADEYRLPDGVVVAFEVCPN